MYGNGLGVPQDAAEAERWNRLAAENGDPGAQYSLGRKYDSGGKVPEDDTEAVRWYRLAAAQGYPDAQLNLGRMYRDGRGVLQDSVIAHMWLIIASANGNIGASNGRDRYESDMTPAEIRRATELAQTCMASNYQNCEP